MHPGIAETYRRRIERLTAALAHPDDAAEAAEAIREIIDRIVITPGPTRRDLSVTLQGELGAILDWIDRTGKPGYKPTPDTASTRLSVSSMPGLDPPSTPFSVKWSKDVDGRDRPTAVRSKFGGD